MWIMRIFGKSTRAVEMDRIDFGKESARYARAGQKNALFVEKKSMQWRTLGGETGHRWGLHFDATGGEKSRPWSRDRGVLRECSSAFSIVKVAGAHVPVRWCLLLVPGRSIAAEESERCVWARVCSWPDGCRYSVATVRGGRRWTWDTTLLCEKKVEIPDYRDTTTCAPRGNRDRPCGENTRSFTARPGRGGVRSTAGEASRGPKIPSCRCLDNRVGVTYGGYCVGRRRRRWGS